MCNFLIGMSRQYWTYTLILALVFTKNRTESNKCLQKEFTVTPSPDAIIHNNELYHIPAHTYDVALVFSTCLTTNH